MLQGFGVAAGFWDQVLTVSAWSGLSLGMLAGLAALVWLDPKLLKLAIAGAAIVAAGYIGELHGDAVGLRDGKAEVQAKWDAEKRAIAKARAEEQVRQQAAAAAQKANDDAIGALLKRQTEDAQAAVAAQADGRKALTESWRRARKLRGIK